ncbi:MAG: 3-oxoacyl-[acyl-carrier-protein] synthase III C-terminal domain-containing protein, partial [Pseudomonadota bacterium]
MRGLASYSVYVPWRRLDRKSIAASHAWFAPALRSLAKGERAIAQWDEDAITLGVEAARGCVVDPETNAAVSLTLSSTSLPYIDRQNAGVIKEALRLSDAISTSDLTGSRRAGTSALLQALDRSGEALCISAEKARPQPMSDTELLLGDGAAAFRVSDRDVIAELVGSVSISADFVDHFQPVDHPSYQWESRWIRDEGYGKIVPQAFDALSEKTGVAAGEIAHFAFDAPTPGTQRRVARALGLQDEAASPRLSAEIGFVSAAHPLLMLADALARAAPGELILVAAFGQGCDMLL